METLATLDLGTTPVVLRRAQGGDVPAIVALLAADQLGAARDGARTARDLAAYQAAFRAIDSDPAHVLVVAESGQTIVGTMQLSFIPGLARRGALRAQIEAVRVHEAWRGRGLGGAVVAWAVSEAPAAGLRACAVDYRQVQDRRTPLLRTDGLRRFARGDEAGSAAATAPYRSSKLGLRARSVPDRGDRAEDRRSVTARRTLPLAANEQIRPGQGRSPKQQAAGSGPAGGRYQGKC